LKQYRKAYQHHNTNFDCLKINKLKASS